MGFENTWWPLPPREILAVQSTAVHLLPVPREITTHWIGLRENLQETIDFPIKYGVFPVKFPLNQSIEPREIRRKM